MSGWHYIEPFCGSAAICLALHGEKRAIVPYQGSKWRHRHGILAAIRGMGFEGEPGEVSLSDAGPWGVVAPLVCSARHRAEVLEELRAYALRDPREAYDHTCRSETPKRPPRYAAAFLFLQRLSFAGAAVGDKGRQWAPKGFNNTSAYGVGRTERFGPVLSQLPNLLRTLEGYTLDIVQHTSGRRLATPPAHPVDRPTLVYLDPPYLGTTRYPCATFGRPPLVALALAWQDAGASVVVSEDAAVEELVIFHGWHARPLPTRRPPSAMGTSKQNRREWITTSEAWQ